MEITVITRETIKPSSPTPQHLHHLKLSLIDQYMHPAYYARILLLYPAQGHADMSHRLKKSLSEALTQFYPLAGRFNNNHSIHCNDDGLEYIEARVKPPFTLDQLLIASPKPEQLDQLIPYDVYNYETGFKGLSAVQVTVFDDCGGMAIGVSLSHVLADASCLATFINSWAEIARRGDACMPNKTVAAKFDGASLFPPRDTPVQAYEEIGTAKKLITKRFAFPQLKIETLKGKFAYQRPTRVEVVCALILKCLIDVNSKSRSSSKSISMAFAINLRSRIRPPLPVHFFGNMALPLMWKQSGPQSLNGLGVQLRKLIREIDSEYVEKLRADNSLLLFESFEQLTKLHMDEDVRFLALSSWCGFPFYGVDFGWGGPALAAPISLKFQDSITLLDAKNGDGIEVWLTLDEEDMKSFESEKELTHFASMS